MIFVLDLEGDSDSGEGQCMPEEIKVATDVDRRQRNMRK